MSAVLLIARRELAAYLKTMSGYVIIAAILAVNGLLFNAFAMGGDSKLSAQVLSLFELLEVSQAITQQEQFRGQGLYGETLAFAALMFWTVSYTMSRESQRLERRLGVGVR